MVCLQDVHILRKNKHRLSKNPKTIVYLFSSVLDETDHEAQSLSSFVFHCNSLAYTRYTYPLKK